MTDLSSLIVAKKTLDENSENVLASLKDTSIPLQERWDAYTQLCQHNILVKDRGYGDGFISILDLNGTLYDDFYMERGNTKDFVDMYEQILESDEEYTEENIEKWQEAVLASGYSSFTYDW